MDRPRVVRAYRAGLLLVAALLPLGVLAVVRSLPPLEVTAGETAWAIPAALGVVASVNAIVALGTLVHGLRRGSLAALLGAGAAAAVVGGSVAALAGEASLGPSLVGGAALLTTAAVAARFDTRVGGRRRRVWLATALLAIAEALALVAILPPTRPDVTAAEPLLLGAAVGLAGIAALIGTATVLGWPALLCALGALALLMARGPSLEQIIGLAALAAAPLLAIRSVPDSEATALDTDPDRLPALAEHVTEAILRFDGRLRLCEWNTVAARLLGLDGGSAGSRMEDLVGVTLADLPQPGATARGVAVGGLEVFAQRSQTGVIAVVRDPGEPSGEDQLARELRGTIEELLAARRTIELQRAEIERAAAIDPLTGVGSRAAILERLRLEIAQARRYQHSVAVVHLDVDGFAELNARHGIGGADGLLREVALRMRLRVRDADALGRAGSDGFLAVLPHTDESGAATFADALRRRIAQRPVLIGDELVQVTVSAGVAVMRPGEDLDLDALVARVGEALDSARSAGGDRIALDRLHGLARLGDRRRDGRGTGRDDQSTTQDSGA